MSQQKTDDYIEIEVNKNELDLTSAETKDTYKLKETLGGSLFCVAVSQWQKSKLVIF